MTIVLSTPARPVRPGVRRRWFRPLLGLWRASLVLLGVAVVSQPVTMGLYLAGRYPMVGVHGLVGSLVTGLAMLVAALALGYAVAGGRVWVVPVCVALFLGCGLQTGMGYARNLAVHVPLGVAVVSATLLLAAWSWTRGAGRSRERAPRDRELSGGAA